MAASGTSKSVTQNFCKSGRVARITRLPTADGSLVNWLGVYPSCGVDGFSKLRIRRREPSQQNEKQPLDHRFDDQVAAMGGFATARKTKTATDETRIKHGLAAPGTPRPDSRGGLAATSGVQKHERTARARTARSVELVCRMLEVP